MNRPLNFSNLDVTIEKLKQNLGHLQDIRDAFAKGGTLKDIGGRLGLTRERARQYSVIFALINERKTRRIEASINLNVIDHRIQTLEDDLILYKTLRRAIKTSETLAGVGIKFGISEQEVKRVAKQFRII